MKARGVSSQLQPKVRHPREVESEPDNKALSRTIDEGLASGADTQRDVYVRSRPITAYSTLMKTETIAFASSTVRTSLPSLTTTKASFSGTGLLGVVTTAVPVQFELTV